MSKKIKSLIEKELTVEFASVEGVGVINPRGMDGNKNNNLRRKLHAKGLKLLVVKNTLARRASAGSKIYGFDKLLDGPSAVIYGKAGVPDIARLLMDEKKIDEKLELRGVFFDGEAYLGDAGVKTVSSFPTREEAIAGIVGAILGPGSALAGAITGPGGTVGALIAAIEAKAESAETPAA